MDKYRLLVSIDGVIKKTRQQPKPGESIEQKLSDIREQCFILKQKINEPCDASCPKCKSDDFDTGYPTMYCHGELQQDCVCNDCKHEWSNVYMLSENK